MRTPRWILVSLLLALLAPSAPAATAGQLAFKGEGVLQPYSGGGGVFEVKLLLDGVVVAQRTYQPAYTGVIVLETPDLIIAPGHHRLSFQLVRQVTSPSTYFVSLYAVVIDLSTYFSQQFSLPGGTVVMSLSNGQSVDLDFTAGQAPPALCIPSATTLCLDDQPGDGRFQIQAAFQTTQGGGFSGNAQAISLSSLGVTYGGLMWFFSPDNPELLVKILPYGCATNGYFWVFASAGTNVGLVITITDLKTSRQQVYVNPDVHPMTPIQDNAAFPCP